MSIVLITSHDESIYDITEKKSQSTHERTKQVYKSRHHKRKATATDYARGDTSLTLRAHATMGVPAENLPNPCTFLKKHTGACSHTEQRMIDAFKETHVCCRRDRMIPNKEEIAEYNKRKQEEAAKSKNFVVKNIKTVMKMKAKEPEQKVVLDRFGESKPVTAGIEPFYIKSDLLGKTPVYLKTFIKRSEQLHQMARDASGVEKPKCQYIRRDQREQLLEGLKHNWEELQKQYQGLPILTDTIPKILRKSKLEAELRQLEKDIVLIERHPYIYVYDDDAQFN